MTCVQASDMLLNTTTAILLKSSVMKYRIIDNIVPEKGAAMAVNILY